MITKSKRSKKSGKRTRLISIKKLQKLCEEEWKAVILERDGAACQVKKQCPYIHINHTNIFQADHCISRKNKLLFLDPRNGTMVCSACNQVKGFNGKSMARAIDTIVATREGTNAFDEMVQLDMTQSINYNWNKRWWLEEQLERLKLEKLKIRGRAVRSNTI